EPWLGSMNFAPRATSAQKSVPFCAWFEGPNEKPVEIVFADGTSWSRRQTSAAPGGAPATSLAGVWKDDSGNEATIVVKPDGKSLEFKSESFVWWRKATGSWKNTNPYQGSVTFTDEHPARELTQRLTFCVKKDLNTMVFGNGSRWQRVQN